MRLLGGVGQVSWRPPRHPALGATITAVLAILAILTIASPIAQGVLTAIRAHCNPVRTRAKAFASSAFASSSGTQRERQAFDRG
jgi:hypothetical protein